MNYVDLDGDLTAELDEANDVIRLRAAATFGDPVELTADGARELAQQLMRMAEELG